MELKQILSKIVEYFMISVLQSLLMKSVLCLITLKKLLLWAQGREITAPVLVLSLLFYVIEPV